MKYVIKKKINIFYSLIDVVYGEGGIVSCLLTFVKGLSQNIPHRIMQIGKTAQNAIAAVSYLAECYRDDVGKVSSQMVADARRISKPLAAKILTTLSQAGIVKGSTGPGGGYELAKAPKDVTLMDVVSCFELKYRAMACPFGEGWCGNYEPCPLHDQIFELEGRYEKFMEENNFGGFAMPDCCSKWPEEE